MAALRCRSTLIKRRGKDKLVVALDTHRRLNEATVLVSHKKDF